MRWAVVLLVVLTGCTQRDSAAAPPPARRAAQENPAVTQPSAQVPRPLPKTNAEWRKVLTPEQYRITRLKGTERAFSGKYWKTKTPGVYHCVCCGAPLFSSKAKYDSGTGWPSFWAPIGHGAVLTKEDRSWFVRRVEVVCRRCGAHLGHVFPDGPPPTGLRFCINSAALRLEPETAQPPAGPKPAQPR